MVVRRQRPTLEMVAERAGVGRGTVSRVINGSDQVSPTTREVVMQAVRDLGYVPNPAARTLVTQRTETIALVVSEPHEHIFAQPFFAKIVRGVSTELTQRGLQLLLATAGSAAEHERLGEYLASHHVDGVLLASEHRDDPLPARLSAAGVPYVHGGRPLQTERHQVSYVDIDNVGGGYTATRHLLDRGRRRVGTVAGPEDMVAGVERLEGYRKALRDAGHRPSDELVRWGDFSYEGGEAAARALIEAVPDLDAIFVASDLMALAALRILRERGRRVPDDVSIVGYDDSSLGLHSDPPLTTIHQPVEHMGREMARVLVEGMAREHREPVAVIMDTHLVVRDSA